MAIKSERIQTKKRSGLVKRVSSMAIIVSGDVNCFVVGQVDAWRFV